MLLYARASISRIQGLGFRVQGVWGLGLRVRAQGLGFRVLPGDPILPNNTAI